MSAYYCEICKCWGVDLWIFKPCNVGGIYQHFRGVYCLYLQSNISNITWCKNPDQHVDLHHHGKTSGLMVTDVQMPTISIIEFLTHWHTFMHVVGEIAVQANFISHFSFSSVTGFLACTIHFRVPYKWKLCDIRSRDAGGYSIFSILLIFIYKICNKLII